MKDWFENTRVTAVVVTFFEGHIRVVGKYNVLSKISVSIVAIYIVMDVFQTLLQNQT